VLWALVRPLDRPARAESRAPSLRAHAAAA
jgi:hypothetical protein